MATRCEESKGPQEEAGSISIITNDVPASVGASPEVDAEKSAVREGDPQER